MAAPHLPEPVKLFIALLYGTPEVLPQVGACLEAEWGPCDFTGLDHPFDMTRYYEPEMGPNLQRRLLAFDRLVSPEMLIPAKLRCNDIEKQLAELGQRRVNLDIGYLDDCKLVLASCKPMGQKVYLGQGIYADLVARYGHGRYQPFEWTFPDFRDGRYDTELAQMRRRYLEQIRQLRRGESGKS